mgnify:CR=1 FL=1
MSTVAAARGGRICEWTDDRVASLLRAVDFREHVTGEFEIPLRELPPEVARYDLSGQGGIGSFALASVVVFDDRNDSMRLVGMLEPLRANDVPQDSFEKTALDRALLGQNYTDVQKDQGKWYYRRSVALSNFHPACAMCHTNFGAVNTTQWVGALMLRVPVSDSKK